MEKSFNVWLWMAGAFAALYFIGSAIRAESLGTVQVIGSAEAENVKKIALTFDDGPHPVYTPVLLDGLAKRKVKATFFITGENAENYPDLVKRMQEEGHLVGNHTYSHIQLTDENREKFKGELVKTNQIIENLTGEALSTPLPLISHRL